MKCLERNKRTFYYCLYDSEELVTDSQGFKTGEKKVVYKPAVCMKANISEESGIVNMEKYGNKEDYDVTIVTDDHYCPIDEQTVLFIGVEPTFDEVGTPMFNYKIIKVAKSLNSITYRAKRV